jgi:general secretion pathway protein H
MSACNCAASHPAERGFTLLELIVVLVILSLAATALVPLTLTSGRSIDVDAAARELAIGLRATRSAAIYGNREAVFTVDAAAGRYWSDAAPSPKVLPARISAVLGGERSVGRIRFFPDGSASGGALVLRGDERAATIRVDALTGRASVDVGR